jgi:hypothetical protein
MDSLFDATYTDTATDGSYRWWTDDEVVNLFVAQVDIDTNGNPDSNMSYTKEIPTPPLGLSEAVSPVIKVYPNPTADFVSVESGSERGFEYQVLDIDAKVILADRASTQTKRIDVSHLPNDVYLMEITNEVGGIFKLEKLQILR